MAEEKDRQQQEQPAEDLTPEMQKEIISIAATYTSKPASRLSLREALEILRKNGELSINSAEYEKAARIGAQIAESYSEIQDLLAGTNLTISGAEYEKAVRIGTELAESYSEMQSTLAGVKETFSNIMRGAVNFFQSEEWQRTQAALAELAEKAPLWLAIATEISELEPYIREEMKKPEYEGMTLEELYQDGTDDETGDIIPGSLFDRLIKAAGTARDQSTDRKQLPQIHYTKTPKIELTVGKLEGKFFAPTALPPKPNDINGQMSFIPLKYERDGAKKEITLFYNYFFDEKALQKIGLQKNIDDQDYFILSFLFNNYMAGNKLLTVTKLYKDMTGEDPNDKEKTNLTNRLIRLATTSIFINDKQVSEAWNLPTYNERLTRLAPIEIGTKRFTANGKIAEGGILIENTPAIMQLSYEMGQYTTVPIALLQVKKKDGRRISRTARFYRVLHYLIRRIAPMKTGNLSNKILYKTFFEETDEAKTTNGQRAALKTMYEILEHFKNCGWIDGYKEQTTKTTGETCVVIACKKEKAAKRISRKKN